MKPIKSLKEKSILSPPNNLKVTQSSSFYHLSPLEIINRFVVATVMILRCKKYDPYKSLEMENNYFKLSICAREYFKYFNTEIFLSLKKITLLNTANRPFKNLKTLFKRALLFTVMIKSQIYSF